VHRYNHQGLADVLIEELHFDYVIPFLGNITVTAAIGEVRAVAAWPSSMV